MPVIEGTLEKLLSLLPQLQLSENGQFYLQKTYMGIISPVLF